MKRNAMKALALAALCLLLAWPPAPAQGETYAGEYDAQIAARWLDGFAAALDQLSLMNDPAQTADPARAGQYLMEYEFGTVLASTPASPAAQEIIEIDVRNAQVTDCRGVRVGMGLEAALVGGISPQGAQQAVGAQLAVLSTQESGYGWSWAYMNGTDVYGVEYITYGGNADGTMNEYTLTYVITDGAISAIRMKTAASTLAQAEDGLRTAEEIAARQTGAAQALAYANRAAAFAEGDMQAMGGDALGQPVDELIMRMGEPQDVQTLPSAQGRILVYDGAAVRLGLDEYTGVEVVRGVSVSSEAIAGPRGLSVGFSVSEATALFRCDADMLSSGGVLYEDADGSGDGEAIVGEDGTITLRYTCSTGGGETAVLEIGAEDGTVTYWHLYYQSDLSAE